MSASSLPASAPGRRLTFGVVGTGRVGAVLGAALAAAGHRPAAVSARSHTSRARAAALLPDVPVRPADEVARAAGDLLLVTVPDDALGPLVADLAAAGALHAGQVVAHTSGVHGTAVLEAAVRCGARPLALHPAMTFTGTSDDLPRLAGVSYGVTAPNELRTWTVDLVRDLGGVCEWIDEHHRPLYHAALAHGANHLVTLVNEAADRLRDAGVTNPAEVLAPLLRAALDNALRSGDQALTGPVSRGDTGTVAGHLAALAQVSPSSLPVYRALARLTAARAVSAGRLAPTAAAALYRVLDAPVVPTPAAVVPTREAVVPTPAARTGADDERNTDPARRTRWAA